MNHHFSAWKKNLDGNLSNRVNLGHAELDQWLHGEAYGKFSTVVVYSHTSQVAVTYTDNGEKWEKVSTDHNFQLPA